ncbi:hemocyte protein-glutamine gamma-glutamyltransferase-like [Arctopsyche grandis]|uniref:hemocyte protein-glutamine gamma-glutamyltransferase-like n=1 Tax=Arctopsyche grandis TaxID=121162 RepID=UPI00406D8CF4
MEPLEVETVYFYPLENASRHHTDKFELVHSDPRTPVLRRGQSFSAVVRFVNRNYDHSVDQIKLVFSLGENANVIKRTQGAMFVLKENPKPDIYQWAAVITAEQGDDVILEIESPCDAPVGNWNFSLETTVRGHPEKIVKYKYEDDLYIIFNPWNKDDLVHMDDQSLLDEYVLNDVGKIWVGPMGSSKGREWVFGQFQDSVLPSCMLMLDRADLPYNQRGDPIKVTRIISKIVNSNDDQGVLVGRWDGEYEDGTAPAAWTGSAAILEQFLETQDEVSYGQCWVFAGVVTTVCRALGIPSRVVSNLVSAHDANSSLTVDKYYDENMEELNFDPNNPMGEDSIWNYHVWNDVWMTRPDLPIGYGGWQAIDATPQEKSGGFYQCGPASLEAIKQGAVGYQHDVPFLLASVNADLMKWKTDNTQALGYSRIESNKYHIGRLILTKLPFIFDPNGDTDREDITDQYKAKEGTEAERLSLYNGIRGSERAKRFYAVPDESNEDVVFDLIELEKINIGEVFNVTVKITNKSNEQRTVKAVLKAGSVYYTGIKSQLVKKAEGKFTMKPKSDENVNLQITSDEYIPKLVEYCNMKIYAICTVLETNQTWAGEDDFQVLKPSIEIKLNDDLEVGKQSIASLSFKNPLEKVLTDCKFHVAGPGLVKRNLIIPHNDVAPHALLWADAPINPTSVGSMKLIVTFSSKELLDVTGSAAIDVY